MLYGQHQHENKDLRADRLIFGLIICKTNINCLEEVHCDFKSWMSGSDEQANWLFPRTHQNNSPKQYKVEQEQVQ